VLAAFAVTEEISSVAGRSESEGEGALVSGARACLAVLCSYPGKELWCHHLPIQHLAGRRHGTLYLYLTLRLPKYTFAVSFGLQAFVNFC
jgi:hypothetical protein